MFYKVYGIALDEEFLQLGDCIDIWGHLAVVTNVNAIRKTATIRICTAPGEWADYTQTWAQWEFTFRCEQERVMVAA